MLRRPENKAEGNAAEREYFDKLFAFTENSENAEKLSNKEAVEKFTNTLSVDAKRYGANLSTKEALEKPITCKSGRGGIFTYTNCETQPISGFDDTYTKLLAQYGLTGVKIDGDVVIRSGESIPELAVHQASGTENKEIREGIERDFLQDVVLELLKTHKKVRFQIDAQEKFFNYKLVEVEREVKNDKGEIKTKVECQLQLEEKDGRMVLSPAAGNLLNKFSKVAVSDFHLADGINTKQRGFTTAANQQQTKAQEIVPDACLCIIEFVSKDVYPSDRKNSDILKDYLPPLISSVHSFNKEPVPDHPDVHAESEVDGVISERDASGDLSQKGIKGLSKIEKFYLPIAYDPITKEKKPEVIAAEEADTIKLFQVFLNKLGSVVVTNADKIPDYPPKETKTNAERFNEFMAALAKNGVTNPKEITFEQMEKVLQSGSKQRAIATEIEKFVSTQAIDSPNRNTHLAEKFEEAVKEYLSSDEYKKAASYKHTSLKPENVKAIVAESNKESRSKKRSTFQTFIEIAVNSQLMAGFPEMFGKTAVSKDDLLDTQENRKVRKLCESTLKGRYFNGSTTEASNDETTRQSDVRVTQKAKNTLAFAHACKMHLQPQVSLAANPNGSYSPKAPASPVQPDVGQQRAPSPVR